MIKTYLFKYNHHYVKLSDFARLLIQNAYHDHKCMISLTFLDVGGTARRGNHFAPDFYQANLTENQIRQHLIVL